MLKNNFSVLRCAVEKIVLSSQTLFKGRNININGHTELQDSFREQGNSR
ncbi:MAG: hypothetical protein ACI9RU_000023 [Litorivivens sp.]